MAQCGPEAGLAAYDAWKIGGAFAAWKKAFAAHDLKPYEARRTPDGRRNAVAWPSVGRKAEAPSIAEASLTDEPARAHVVSDWGPLNLKETAR